MCGVRPSVYALFYCKVIIARVLDLFVANYLWFSHFFRHHSSGSEFWDLEAIQKVKTMSTEESDWKAGLTAPKADERYKTEVRYNLKHCLLHLCDKYRP